MVELLNGAVSCAEGGPVVNIILFASAAPRQTLARTDPRARHLLEVLRCGPGDDFRAGVIDGPTGTGSLLAIGDQRLELAFRWHGTAPPLDDITLIVGLPRPPSARKILYQAAALGCREILFVHTESSDPNYARSRLWTSGEWRRHLVDGLQQSVATALPAVTCGTPLRSALQQRPADAAAVVLDNVPGVGRLGACTLRRPLLLALGPERGWTDADRALLRHHRFEPCTLGERILRVETACVAALAIAKSRLGLM